MLAELLCHPWRMVIAFPGDGGAANMEMQAALAKVRVVRVRP
jgi:hypothetical protein